MDFLRRHAIKFIAAGLLAGSLINISLPDKTLSVRKGAANCVRISMIEEMAQGYSAYAAGDRALVECGTPAKSDTSFYYRNDMYIHPFDVPAIESGVCPPPTNPLRACGD